MLINKRVHRRRRRDGLRRLRVDDDDDGDGDSSSCGQGGDGAEAGKD